MIYSDLNCFDAAIEWGKKGLALGSDNKFANSFLGEVYLNSGDFKNAKKYFEQSIKIDSNWVFGWYLGARIESVLGNYELSKKYFDKYLGITQTAPEYFYAHTLMKLNENDSAQVIINEELQDYGSYLKDEPKFDVFNYMAFAEVHAINKDEANTFKWWRKALSKGYVDANRVKVFPYFENLRDEPQYSILYDKMQTKLDSFKTEIHNNFPEYSDCK
jgi:tetratricopeptide (TPR) repeat protein